ncbi:gluconokinase [Allonocardiopsis opalescens]|uniref:Gluconokinase n=1 Tax=Allonocardiopsis opalescens TaxID=1144618 RepID=A0A2T0Q0S9_9ACTN|nr:gluconokinase [Allonocardiopsis opalescens]PRX97390.1 gluconate kinase (SKI family) [Allonocardiopsis opalescens]
MPSRHRPPEAGPSERPRPVHLIVMGVSGAGKTTVGELLAERLGYRYAEADEFHPPANIAKMEHGTPLGDADRLPWLEALAEWTGRRDAEGVSTVLACSALKRRYRDILRRGAPGVRFVHLGGSPELIRQRITARKGHFMPAGLLDSQLRDLEPLGADEDGVTVDVGPGPEEITDKVIAKLR